MEDFATKQALVEAHLPDGILVRIKGETTAGLKASTYLVKTAAQIPSPNGTTQFAIANGNVVELLDVEQRTTTSTGGQTLSAALDDRVIKRDTVAAMKASNLSSGQLVRTNTYAGAAGSGGTYLIQTAAEFGGTPDGYGDHTLANGNVAVLQRVPAMTTLQFGATGDGATDDALAIQAALNCWKLSGNSLIFPGEYASYSMASPVSIDFGGESPTGTLIMEGSIKPAAGIGNAMTFLNLNGGFLQLRVQGGGDTANYSLADPAGAAQAFVFENPYATTIDYVEGKNYLGRVLRIKNNGAIGTRSSQWLTVNSLYGDSTAAISDPEATRLAQGVGQLFYIDSAGPAFGAIKSVKSLWDLYGPVLENVTDVSLGFIETLFRGNSGLELRGVISFWGGKLLVGSGLKTFPNMRIIRSATRQSYNIHIDTLFTNEGSIGLDAVDIADDGDVGLVISSMHSRLNGKGLSLSGCRKFNIKLQSYADTEGLQIISDCLQGAVDCMVHSSKQTAISIGGTSSDIILTGMAIDGNIDNIASTSLVDVNTTGSVEFNSFVATSDRVDYLYDITTGNLLFNGGRVNAAGTAQIINGFPDKVSGVSGWSTKGKGSATILSGTSSIAVSHNLIKVPSAVAVAGKSSETQTLYVSGVTASQFVINVPSPVTSNQSVFWEAQVDYNY